MFSVRKETLTTQGLRRSVWTKEARVRKPAIQGDKRPKIGTPFPKWHLLAGIRTSAWFQAKQLPTQVLLSSLAWQCDRRARDRQQFPMPECFTAGASVYQIRWLREAAGCVFSRPGRRLFPGLPSGSRQPWSGIAFWPGASDPPPLFSAFFFCPHTYLYSLFSFQHVQKVLCILRKRLRN